MQRYLFRVSDDLLELDALELDSVLRHVLQDVPNGGALLLHLSPDPVQPPTAKARKQTERAPKPLVCTVDHDAGMLLGEGLGEAFARLATTVPPGLSAGSTSAALQEWVIEGVPPAVEPAQRL